LVLSAGDGRRRCFGGRLVPCVHQAFCHDDGYRWVLWFGVVGVALMMFRIPMGSHCLSMASPIWVFRRSWLSLRGCMDNVEKVLLRLSARSCVLICHS
jgi:hypothetical protein